jgi:hypothetical protein
MWSSSIFQPLRKGVVKSCNQSDSAHCMNQSSLAKQCCGSGMFITDPGSQIPNTGSKYSTKRGGRIFFPTIFCIHKYHKIQNYFIFGPGIIVLFYPKFVIKLSKIWVWDLGSEIRALEKAYSGSRIQGSKKTPVPGSGSATLLLNLFFNNADRL